MKPTKRGSLGKGAAGSGWDFDHLMLRMARAPIFAARKQRSLKALEGKKGQPRLKPPFPAGAGPLWLSVDGKQCGINRRRADNFAPGRRLVCRNLAVTTEQAGTKVFLHFRARKPAVQRGRSDVDSAESN